MVYSVAGVGNVVGGPLLRGTVREGDELLLGPTDDGCFHTVTVGSLHRNRLACRTVTAGQAACLSLNGVPGDCNIRKVSI